MFFALNDYLHIPHTSLFFFFNDTATTEIYTLSLHDALPISWIGTRRWSVCGAVSAKPRVPSGGYRIQETIQPRRRSEEHTSELQSPDQLVCRLLLEKKKQPVTAATDRPAPHPSRARPSDQKR